MSTSTPAGTSAGASPTHGPGLERTSQAMPGLIAVLDVVDDLPGASELRARSYQLLASVPGKCVVDVGCGTGRAVGEMHQRGVRAIGVDLDGTMLAVARERWSASPFQLADAYELPLADGEADGYRADKLYHALDDPGRALVEARRVLAPGGRIVLIGQDWDTFIIDSDQPELTRIMVAARADTVPSPRAARAYRALLLDHGFTDVTVEVHTGIFTDPRMLPVVSGLADTAVTREVLSSGEVEGWIREQTERARDGRLFLAIPLFAATGTRG